MNHRVDITFEEKKRGFLRTRTVRETRSVSMDERTYRKLKKRLNAGRSITVDDLIMYDCVLEE